MSSPPGSLLPGCPAASLVGPHPRLRFETCSPRPFPEAHVSCPGAAPATGASSVLGGSLLTAPSPSHLRTLPLTSAEPGPGRREAPGISQLLRPQTDRPPPSLTATLTLGPWLSASPPRLTRAPPAWIERLLHEPPCDVNDLRSPCLWVSCPRVPRKPYHVRAAGRTLGPAGSAADAEPAAGAPGPADTAGKGRGRARTTARPTGPVRPAGPGG